MHCLDKPKVTKRLHKGTHQVGLAIKISTTIGAKILIEKVCAIHAWTQQRVDEVLYANLERICSIQHIDLEVIILMLQSILTILCKEDFKIMRSKTQKSQTSLKVMIILM